MRAVVKNYVDCWMDIKETTMTTIGKDTGKYPTSEWKRKLLLSEHSPIRTGMIRVKIYDIPYWVAGHLVRHHIGVEKFMSTQRTDRTGVDRTKLPQDNLVDLELHMNFQAIINISRKRLCYCASAETRKAWELVINAIKEYEPELYSVCVPDCIYKGWCTEMFPCNYHKTKKYDEDLNKYRNFEVSNGETK